MLLWDYKHRKGDNMMNLTEKQIEDLESEIKEIIDYLLINQLISGKKKKANYIYEDKIFNQDIYDPEEVFQVTQEIAKNSNDINVLRLLLKSKNITIRHQIAYNPSIFNDLTFVDELLNNDKHMTFCVYNNPSLPDVFIENKIQYIRETYTDLPSTFFDLLFKKDIKGDYINIRIGSLGKVEELVARLTEKYVLYKNSLDAIKTHLTRLKLDELAMNDLINILTS